MVHLKKQHLHAAWDHFISVVATLAALAIPMRLVFGFLGQDVLFFLGGVTLLFGIDMVVRYRRAIQKRAQALHERAAHNARDIRKGLVVDGLAALPLYALLYLIFEDALAPEFQVLLLLRLAKLYRVAGFMREWRRRQMKYANMLLLAFFAYWLVIAAHWISCGWMQIRPAAPGTPYEIQYLDAIYWCVTTFTTVGYGDVVPESTGQKLYTIMVMILGVGVYGFIIGNVATILTNIDPAKAHHLKQQERLTAFMRYRKVPAPLQQRIRAYYEYLWEKRLVFDERLILQDLPPSLSTEVSLFLKRDLIEKVPLFSGASEAFVEEVAVELHPFVYLPGDCIVKVGERGRDMYFISQGTVEILAPDGETVYAVLSDGDFFGEIALFLDQSRTASARAITYCDVYCLDQVTFERVLANYPDIASHLKTLAQERYRSDQAQ